jgi:hypothetical protein
MDWEWVWRLHPESNRGARICNPLRHHSAIEPDQRGVTSKQRARFQSAFSLAARLSRIAPNAAHAKGRFYVRFCQRKACAHEL